VHLRAQPSSSNKNPLVQSDGRSGDCSSASHSVKDELQQSAIRCARSVVDLSPEQMREMKEALNSAADPFILQVSACSESYFDPATNCCQQEVHWDAGLDTRATCSILSRTHLPPGSVVNSTFCPMIEGYDGVQQRAEGIVWLWIRAMGQYAKHMFIVAYSSPEVLLGRDFLLKRGMAFVYNTPLQDLLSAKHPFQRQPLVEEFGQQCATPPHIEALLKESSLSPGIIRHPLIGDGIQFEFQHGYELAMRRSKYSVQKRNYSDYQLEKGDEQMSKWVAEGVIEEDPAFEGFFMPLVFAYRKPSDIEPRVCHDGAELNSWLKVDPLMKTSFDSPTAARKLAKYKYNCVLDLKKSFNQMPLAMKVIGHMWRGKRYRINKAVFGLNFFTALMHMIVADIIHDLPYAVNIVDDIGIGADTLEELTANLNLVLSRFLQHGIAVNYTKCKLYRLRVIFVGFLVGGGELSIDPSKQAAIRRLAFPSTAEKMRSVLAMVKYSSIFVPSYGPLSAPLWALTNSKRYNPTDSHRKTFNALKEAFADSLNLSIQEFTSDSELVLVVDSSKTEGMAATLYIRTPPSASNPREILRPLAVCSRKLTAGEKKLYSSSLEPICLVWAIKQMEAYLRGRVFTVRTDHQALNGIGRLGKTHVYLNNHIEFLNQFTFLVEWYPGNKHQQKDPRKYEFVMQPTDVLTRAESFGEATPIDWESLGEDLIPFSVLACRVHATVIPEEELQRLHGIAHQNSAAMVAQAVREGTLQRGLGYQSFTFVRKCNECRAHNPKPVHAVPLTPKANSKYPFQHVAIDVVTLPVDVEGYKKVLILKCLHSGIIILRVLAAETAQETVRALLDIFSFYLIPQTILMDNGKNFVSLITKEFDKLMQTEFRLVTPYQPQARQAERPIRDLRDILKKAFVGKDMAEQSYVEVLPIVMLALNSRMKYNQYSPYSVMLGRRPPTWMESEEKEDRSWQKILEELTTNLWPAIVRTNEAAKNRSNMQAMKTYSPEKMLEFIVGDRVAVRVEGRTKMEPRYDLNYKIVQIELVDDIGLRYQVERLVDGEWVPILKRYNANQLTFDHAAESLPEVSVVENETEINMASQIKNVSHSRRAKNGDTLYLCELKGGEKLFLERGVLGDAAPLKEYLAKQREDKLAKAHSQQRRERSARRGSGGDLVRLV
jgi:hypothetical protein